MKISFYFIMTMVWYTHGTLASVPAANYLRTFRDSEKKKDSYITELDAPRS